MITQGGRPVAPRWWQRSVRLVVPILVTVVCLVLLIASLPLYPSLLIAGSALMLLLCVGLIWLVLLGIQLWKYRWDFGILIAPIIAAVAVAAIAGGAMQRLGWTLSHAELTTLAQACGESSDVRWAGVYRVTSVDRTDVGCLLYMDPTFMGPAGIAYAPDGVDRLGLPPGEGMIGYTEMPVGNTDGPWYQFEFGW